MVDIGVPPFVDDLLDIFGLGGDEDWKDRLRQAKYTSPEGTEITFLYEDVERRVTRRGTVFQFPNIDDVFIQQKGFGARRYPLRVIFAGSNHDRVATAFEALILEPGIGQLDHPMYGVIPNVVPHGEIVRRDDLRTAANQTIVEVTFWTTLTQIFPSAEGNPENEILASLGDFDVEASQAFDANTDLSTLDKILAVKSDIRNGLVAVNGIMSDAADAGTLARRQFDDSLALIEFGLDVLILQPALLARNILELIRAPASAPSSITTRLEAYALLSQTIINSPGGRPEDNPVSSPSAVTKRANSRQVADLFAMGAASGSVQSSLDNQFATKPNAINAAGAVTDNFDAVVLWRDEANEVIGSIDTGEAYQALQEATALTAGFLVEISFSLLAERVIVLDRARTIVDLAAELYGTVDAVLDRLILNNRLTGSEILELPKGRRILYYPN